MDIQKIRVLVEPVIAGLGCEVLEIRFLTEMGRRVLRIAIDRPEGVQVGDCERASREISTLLDVEGIGDRYFLEISSPGLDRPLVKEADFVRFTGKMASLKTREPVVEHGGRRNYKGTLKGVEEGRVVMTIDGQDYWVPLSLIERASLVY